MRGFGRVLAVWPALAFLHVAPANAQTWNLYEGDDSLFIHYASGGHHDSPELNVGFNNSGTFAEFTMDTGSVGIVASPDKFQLTSANKYIGPGQQVYSSSGVIEIGAWYTATQQIYHNGEVVATADVPVLLVTEIQCEVNARHCTATNTPTGISMMGVGFGRQVSDPVDKTPNYNPFVNLTAVRLTPGGPLVPLPSNWNNGYVVTSDGVHLGLSSSNTNNAGFVKLRADEQDSTAGQVEWRPAKMRIGVNGVYGDGNVLMDTGVGTGYLKAPDNSIPRPYAWCSDGVRDCAHPSTLIEVALPGETGETAFFQYRLTGADPMSPTEVVVVDQTGNDIFYNTSRYVLQGLDYIYDAENGFVGYRWKNTAGTDGHVNVMLALESDFEIPDGFRTDMPVALFGDTRLLPEGTAEFSGVISGTDKLTIDGPGRVVLSGNSTFSHDAEVTGGTLSVNGSVTARVVVENGGTLGGTGTMGSDVDVHAGGTYAPGNSIGTQVVSGNLVFQPGSTFEVEFNAAGASDRSEVYGAIEINGGALQIVLEEGSYAPSQTYRVIDNFGSFLVNGAFDQIVNPYVFFFATVDYNVGTGDDVEVTLVRSTDFSAVARTLNELQVSTTIEQLPLSNPLVSAVQFQTLSGALEAFNALSGELHATTGSVLADQTRYLRQALLGRLMQAGSSGNANSAALALGAAPTEVAARPAGMMALGAGGDDWGARPENTLPGLVFWTKAYGAWGAIDGNANAASVSRTLGGVLTGADIRVAGDWRAGFATGYSQSSVEVAARSSSASIDSVQLASYAGGSIGGGVLRSGAAWSWDGIDSNRAVVFPGFFEQQSASYGGDTGQVFGEFAMPTPIYGFVAEPFAGLAYVHVGLDGFTESGPLASLRGAAASDDVAYTTFGARIGSASRLSGMALTARGSLGWQHAFGDVTPEAALAFVAGGSGFIVDGVPIAENSALIEGSIDLEVMEQAVVELSYFGQLATDAHDNAVEGRFRWSF
jgi:outer membrane autotransporter protein